MPAEPKAAPSPRPVPASASSPSDQWYRRRLVRRIGGMIGCVLAVIILPRIWLGTATGQIVDTVFMRSLMRWETRLEAVGILIRGLVSIPAIIIVAALVVVVAVARRRPTLAGRALSMVVAANVTTQLIKYFLDRPDFSVTWVSANSLPSGHTTVALSVALAALIVAPEWLRGPMAAAGWIWASLMGISVMMSGWHRLSDVLVAVFVTGAWALALTPIERRRRHAPGMQRAMMVVVGVAAIVGAIMTFIALAGVDLGAIPDPADRHFGYTTFLAGAPSRAALLAVASVSWVVSAVGLIVHEVDVLCADGK